MCFIHYKECGKNHYEWVLLYEINPGLSSQLGPDIKSGFALASSSADIGDITTITKTWVIKLPDMMHDEILFIFC